MNVFLVGVGLISLARTVDTCPNPPCASPLVESITELYTQQDAAGLHLLRERASAGFEDYLIRYRLFPLTSDATLLDDLPTDLDVGTPAELALLSALWSYRASHSAKLRVPVYARRSDVLLQRARGTGPDDPFVLLVEGQNLLFRPALFGGSPREALDRFTRLRDGLRAAEIRGAPVPGLPLIEAEVWIWYTLDRLGRNGSEAMRTRLLESRPPPVYSAFLVDPP